MTACSTGKNSCQDEYLEYGYHPHEETVILNTPCYRADCNSRKFSGLYLKGSRFSVGRDTSHP